MVMTIVMNLLHSVHKLNYSELLYLRNVCKEFIIVAEKNKKENKESITKLKKSLNMINEKIKEIENEP